MNKPKATGTRTPSKKLQPEQKDGKIILPIAPEDKTKITKVIMNGNGRDSKAIKAIIQRLNDYEKEMTSIKE